MWHDYRVTAPGHTDAGVPLAVDDTLRLRADVAEQFPHVFTRLEAAAPAAKRSTRRATSLAESPAPNTDATEE